jgi:hypothetical protein
VASDVPREVAALVDRALCRDKAARFTDAVSMQEAVREAYDVLEHAAFDDAPTVVVWRRRDDFEPRLRPAGFDDSPRVIVTDTPRPSSSPPPAGGRSSTPPWSSEATAAKVPRASWRFVLAAMQAATHRQVILASAAAGIAAVAAISLLLTFHDDPPKPTATAPFVAAPTPPRRPAYAARPAAGTLDAAERRALSVTDLPRETDEEQGARGHAVPNVVPALASSIARAAEPSSALRPPPPVAPREVHLDEGDPDLGADVENPYGPTPRDTAAASSTPHTSLPVQTKKKPATATPLPSYGPGTPPPR